MQRPINDQDENCPFWQKPVKKVCHKCPMYIQLRGVDPNTGKDIDHWGCAFAWVPTLLVENSQQQRQTGAAVESFRNEMVKGNDAIASAMIVAAQQKLIK